MFMYQNLTANTELGNVGGGGGGGGGASTGEDRMTL